MNRLLTKEEFIKEEGLAGADIWITTMYQQYLLNNKYRMERDKVSKSMYLYGVDASHFNHLVTSQESFVTFRLRYLDHTIRRILSVDHRYRDDDRLRACMKAQKWCEDLLKEIRE